MPMQNEVLRRLRGLPSCWEQRVVESTVDSLRKRADALGRVLAKHRRKRETDDLRRRVSLLDRADELHRHAADVETLVGLYRALRVFTHEREPLAADSFTRAQIGAEDAPSTCHGPAFRQTAALRNRAFRLVAAAIAKYAREFAGFPHR
ncbi:MAG TPA: hypothetical protein VEK07_15425 [Polyangiaceae bacterium]|nr:hypothetical protein [Polyangiaceae bacterium]